MLHRHEVLTWFNKSADVITDMPVHLYLNVFCNDNSTRMTGSSGA